MFTNAFRDSTLGNLGGFIGLFTAISSWRTPSVTEASYTGYGTRPAVTWNSPGDASPAVARQVTNNGAVTFPQNTGASQDVIGWGVYSASTAGTLHAVGLLDSDPPVLGFGNASSELIDAPSHGLATDQRVFVLGVPGAAIPAGLSEGTAYFVLAAGLTADAFALSTSSGGSAVDITADGLAMFIPYKAVTIATNATPNIADTAIVVQL